MLSIDLSGRSILLIGGSRGIGAGITRVLCQAGAHVAFTWTGRPEAAAAVQGLLAEVRAAGGSLQAEAVDALDFPATRGFAERFLRDRGRLDALVCNVGRNTARPAESVSPEEWAAGVKLNLDSAFFAVRAVLPGMLAAGGGRIILIGSSAVFDGGGGAIDYAAAKAGLTGMMSYLCRAYTRKGIRTNIVHPCVIETELLKERYADPASREKLIAQIPVGRMGTPADVAGMVAYLASSWGDYITGQEILLDGGRTFFRG
jgi:NAD(P)-dependent dehydrogenase (short-subunit alcohol dehydrogenase family)